MKAKLSPLLLVLGMTFAAALSQAQAQPSYGYTYGLSVTQSSPSLTTSSTTANLGSVASTGDNKTDTATVQWLAVVTLTPARQDDPNPTTVTVPYKLINYSSGSVDLGGLTPPTGTAQGYGSVANALANTGTVTRGTAAVHSHFVAGPLVQNKSSMVPVSSPGWIDNGDGTFKAFVVLESSVLTTKARIDSVGGAAPPVPVEGGGQTPPPGGTTNPSVKVPGDQATGGVAQSIGAQ